MKILTRVLLLGVVAILALPAWAGVISINDLEESGILLYLDGQLVTAGKFTTISDLQFPDNETVTFAYDTGVAFTGTTGVYYTPIMERGEQAWSDMFTLTATTGSSVLLVAFYSDGSSTFPTNDLLQLPTWHRLTGIAVQGLPDPFWEDGTSQLVGTYFLSNPAVGGDNFNPVGAAPPEINTQFYMSSDGCAQGPCVEPEPATVSMFLGAGLLLAGFGLRKARR